MVLAYGLSTKPMTWNVYGDKEQESNVQAIAEVMQFMEVPVSVGWLAPKKLEAADRLGIERKLPNMPLTPDARSSQKRRRKIGATYAECSLKRWGNCR